MSTNGFPQARKDGLVVRELPDEILVYDLEKHEAHCLNETAAAVWNHCDGETSPSEIGFRLARQFATPVDEDVVWLALEDLGKLQLLETPVTRPTPGLTRGDVIRRAGLVASVLAVPAVFSMAAPTARAGVCNAACAGDPDCAAGPTCKRCVGGSCQP
ncbi:MAG: PqqD family protein [Gaiellaceae bacterium]